MLDGRFIWTVYLVTYFGIDRPLLQGSNGEMAISFALLFGILAPIVGVMTLRGPWVEEAVPFRWRAYVGSALGAMVVLAVFGFISFIFLEEMMYALSFP